MTGINKVIEITRVQGVWIAHENIDYLILVITLLNWSFQDIPGLIYLS